MTTNETLSRLLRPETRLMCAVRLTTIVTTLLMVALLVSGWGAGLDWVSIPAALVVMACSICVALWSTSSILHPGSSPLPRWVEFLAAAAGAVNFVWAAGHFFSRVL